MNRVAASIPNAFQSTPAYGGRRCQSSREAAASSFNPRPRTAGDSQYPCFLGGGACFNPRPRTAGDMKRTGQKQTPNGFQSTPAYGGRHQQKTLAAEKRRFNPRPRTAGDPLTFGCALIQSSFNPRPRTAGDNVVGTWAADLVAFQSTPAYGGRRSPW